MEDRRRSSVLINVEEKGRALYIDREGESRYIDPEHNICQHSDERHDFTSKELS